MSSTLTIRAVIHSSTLFGCVVVTARKASSTCSAGKNGSVINGTMSHVMSCDVSLNFTADAAMCLPSQTKGSLTRSHRMNRVAVQCGAMRPV